MAGYAADVNEYCGRTLFLSCARNMLPLTKTRNARCRGGGVITYGEVFGKL